MDLLLFIGFTNWERYWTLLSTKACTKKETMKNETLAAVSFTFQSYALSLAIYNHTWNSHRQIFAKKTLEFDCMPVN